MADAFDIAALYLHDARCDSDPCYDACTEQHRFGPTVNDYTQAEALVKALGITVAEPPQPCQAETRSWDHFNSEQVDGYWIRCTLLGAHDDHQDEHTGLAWTATAPLLSDGGAA